MFTINPQDDVEGIAYSEGGGWYKITKESYEERVWDVGWWHGYQGQRRGEENIEEQRKECEKDKERR